MLNIWQITIADRLGNVQPYASIMVRRESDQAIMTVYRDRAGTDPYPMGQVAANENGYVYFFVDKDYYRITSPDLGIDWRYVDIGAAGAAHLEDLGTAAFADFTTSHSDNTAERLLRVGDFGVGSSSLTVDGLTITDSAALDALLVSGTYAYTGTSGGPSGTATGTVIHAARTTTGALQIFVSTDTAPRTFTRKMSSSIWSPWIETITASNIASYQIPPGIIFDHSGTTAPVGSLACPTSATNISRTTYAALFAAIGTTWGVGDGSTTFGMPWFPTDYAATHNPASVGTQSVGTNLAHTHDMVFKLSGTTGSLMGVNLLTNTWTGANTACGNDVPQSSGGPANLAAGARVLKCVKF